jgi:hypothetical protein
VYALTGYAVRCAHQKYACYAIEPIMVNWDRRDQVSWVEYKVVIGITSHKYLIGMVRQMQLYLHFCIY